MAMTTYDSAYLSCENHIRLAKQELWFSRDFLERKDFTVALFAASIALRHIASALRQVDRMEWAERNGQGGP